MDKLKIRDHITKQQLIDKGFIDHKFYLEKQIDIGRYLKIHTIDDNKTCTLISGGCDDWDFSYDYYNYEDFVEHVPEEWLERVKL